MKSSETIVGKVFGFDEKVKIRIYDHSPESDCVSIHFTIGLWETNLQLTKKEYIQFLDDAAALIGGVMWLDMEDKDSELVGNPPEDL